MPGQASTMQRLPCAAPSSTLPSASTTCGTTPKNGRVAEPAPVPLPRFRIDRLADRAEQTKALARGLLHRRVARLHERADRGRRRIDDVDLVLVADLPEARHRRIIRHALEHHRDRAVRERSVYD